MKFLIPTEPDDAHAALVKITLEELGHHVRLLFTADLPTKQKNSVFIDNISYQWASTDKNERTLDNDYDVVWWRRARKPFVPKDATHPDDYLFVKQENLLFHESLTYNMAPNAWWINRKEAAMRANSKLLQLKIASACGLLVPTTLCSNDPRDIRYFLLKHEASGVIYKPMCANFWFEEAEVKASYTAKINFMDLPSNKVLQMAPGIYQKEVKKRFELKVTCFGEKILATKINSQAYPEGKLDWRAIPQDKMSVEPYILPTKMEEAIHLFMQKMGLVFGVLDFIVTGEDEFVFLEVNEQGQFFWMEELNPRIKMLDHFIQFITSRTEERSWASELGEHSISRYKAEADNIVMQNQRHHVALHSARMHYFVGG